MSDNVTITIANAIQKRLIDSKITKKRLAEMTGLTPQCLQGIARKEPMRTSTLDKIFQALNMTIYVEFNDIEDVYMNNEAIAAMEEINDYEDIGL